MTACERVCGRLERFLDGTLEPLAEALDRGHLEACAGCRAEESRWTELLQGLRASHARPRAEWEQALSGLEAQLDAQPGGRARWALAPAGGASRWIERPLIATLATAAATMLLLFFLDRTTVHLEELAPDQRALLEWRPSWPDLTRLIGIDGQPGGPGEPR